MKTIHEIEAERIAKDVERFLANNGKITPIAMGVSGVREAINGAELARSRSIANKPKKKLHVWNEQ